MVTRKIFIVTKERFYNLPNNLARVWAAARKEVLILSS